MKFRNSTLIAAAALLAAPAALAQTAQTSPAPATSPQTEPAPGTSGAGTAATATVSESEVTQFATAALAVSKIRQDAAVPDAEKNTKSVAAITATGLTAARFNEIAQAMQGDPALNKRIQDAAAKQTPAAGAAAPAQR